MLSVQIDLLSIAIFVDLRICLWNFSYKVWENICCRCWVRLTFKLFSFFEIIIPSVWYIVRTILLSLDVLCLIIIIEVLLLKYEIRGLLLIPKCVFSIRVVLCRLLWLVYSRVAVSQWVLKFVAMTPLLGTSIVIICNRHKIASLRRCLKCICIGESLIWIIDVDIWRNLWQHLSYTLLFTFFFNLISW